MTPRRAVTPPPAALTRPDRDADRAGDAPRVSILYYALGNIETGLANQLFAILGVVTVVALGMDPLLMGLVITLKTLVEAVADPLMAQLSDNARTRWGRRIPFILGGGVARALLVFALFLFFPRDDSIKTNADHVREKEVAAAVASAPVSAPPSVAQGPAAPAPRPPPSGLVENISRGLDALTTTDAPYHRHVFFYLLGFSLVFCLLGTVNSVPYYALGIEIAPSYDGRTRVVTYRACGDKAMQFLAQWVLPFCFLPMFDTVFDGLVWYGVAVCVIGIPSTVALARKVEEPARSAPDPGAATPGIFRSMWLTARNGHFLKIAALYVLIGFSNGLFIQVGTFLSLYWVFEGDMLAGSIMNGYAGTIATVLGFASLPVIQWACRRFSKHAALRAAIVWMALGAAAKWVLVDPRHPYLQLLLPFFFSVGIGSVYTILPALMADVTDVDELNNGTRREGMFGAVMSFINKGLSSVQPILAAAVLTASGFDASVGLHQPPEVIHNMRLIASWIPAGFMLTALIVLVRYPLTRERMDEIKAALARRRAGQTSISA